MIDQLLVVTVVSLLLLLVAGAYRMRRLTMAGAERRAQSSTDGLDTVAGWPPQAARILSTHERNAHDLLARALPGYMIFGQVPVSRFIKVPTRYSYSQWLRRVGSHCVDLAIADPLSRVVAVVEIRSANAQDKALRRQARVARVLETVNIPLYEWVEGELPSLAEVRDLFKLTESDTEHQSAKNALGATVAVAPAAVDPSKVSFYIASEALAEFPPTQPAADTASWETSSLAALEVRGLSDAESHVMVPGSEPTPQLAGGPSAFAAIDLDLPDLLPPATSEAVAPPTESSTAAVPSYAASAEVSATVGQESNETQARETVLVENMVHEEAMAFDAAPLIASVSALESTIQGQASLDEPPTTWYGELDSQPAPLSLEGATGAATLEGELSAEEEAQKSGTNLQKPIQWPSIEAAPT